MFLIRIEVVGLFFLEGIYAYIKRGNYPLIFYLVIDWFNKNSLPFGPEDVGKLPNLVKILCSHFLLYLLCSCI